MRKYGLFFFLMLALPVCAADDNGLKEEDLEELHIGDLFIKVLEGQKLEQISRFGFPTYQIVKTDNPEDQRVDALIITGLRREDTVITEPGTTITFTSEGRIAFPGASKGIRGFLNRMIGDSDPTQVIFMTTRLHESHESEMRCQFFNEPNEGVLTPTDEYNDDVEIVAEKKYKQPNGSPYIFYKQFCSTNAERLKFILKQYQKTSEPIAPTTKSAYKN